MGELSNTTINGVSYDFKDAGAARQSHSHTKSQITDFPTSMPASDVSAWAKASTKPTYTASEVGAIATSAKGAANGVASLDSTGKVPSSQLPSYVDDVLEYSAKSSFPTTGETGKIYVDTSTNKTYRWSGSAYVEISESLALGETSSTAYRGDKGKAAYDHATESGRLTTATASGLYKVASTAQGHIASLTPVAKSDITGLGIPAQDTTYSAATQSANGLMSSTDKTKLDGIASGAQVNSITGVKGNSESTYRTGNVNITAANIGLGNVGNFKAVSTVASQGLSDTEKSNARANIGAGTGNGTYSKPSGGIPKTDLASAVQTSLGLADGALQHTTVTGSPDLDTYLTTGVYHITTSTATHAPTTNHATLFVDGTVGTPYQIFKPDNVDSPWYTRHRSGSAWTSWVAMKFTDTTYSAATTSAAGIVQLSNSLTSTSQTQAATSYAVKQLNDTIGNINSVLEAVL